MNYDVRTKKTIEEGIQLRDGHEGSIFIHYSPGNGTDYVVSFQSFSSCGQKMRGRIGLGEEGEWLVTCLNESPMVSLVVSENDSVLHWGYLSKNLRTNISDSVVLAELIGHVIGRPYISCEEFLAEKNQSPLRAPCCERDYDNDGNCDRHLSYRSG